MCPHSLTQLQACNVQSVRIPSLICPTVHNRLQILNLRTAKRVWAHIGIECSPLSTHLVGPVSASISTRSQYSRREIQTQWRLRVIRVIET